MATVSREHASMGGSTSSSILGPSDLNLKSLATELKMVQLLLALEHVTNARVAENTRQMSGVQNQVEESCACRSHRTHFASLAASEPGTRQAVKSNRESTWVMQAHPVWPATNFDTRAW